MIGTCEKRVAGSVRARVARPFAATLAGAALLGMSAFCSAQKVTVIQEQSFSYTGSPQQWKVPAGVHSITVDLYGAQGGGGTAGIPGYAPEPPIPGGLGAHVTASIAVKPGQVLQINVGGAGATGSNDGGGTGGGASDVRDGALTLQNRLLVAAGGGGGGGGAIALAIYPGGNSATAGSGNDGSGNYPLNGFGGGAGTQTAGGSAGAGGSGGGVAGNIGLLGSGGAGGDPGGGAAGGNGGDGYYGGGGGGGGGSAVECVPIGGGCEPLNLSAPGGGGGGGSDYASPKAAAVTVTDGVQSGNGMVVLHYTGAGPGSCGPDGDDHHDDNDH